MEKSRDSKLIAIVALLVAVLGLSIGFAAFSSVLTINASANVSPTNGFAVKFSSVNNSVLKEAIKAQVAGEGTVTATDATITDDTTISNLSATFTDPGQSATYTFYAYNAGQYKAFLKSVVMDEKTCAKTKDSEATDVLVEEACEGIVLSVEVGGKGPFITSQATIDGYQGLDKQSADTVTVKIEYLSDAARADGDFSVNFGNVTLNYSSVGSAS